MIKTFKNIAEGKYMQDGKLHFSETHLLKININQCLFAKQTNYGYMFKFIDCEINVYLKSYNIAAKCDYYTIRNH